MKKLVFIYSLNVKGSAFGPVYSTMPGSLKFQAGLRKAMGADWDVEFISADLDRKEPIEGDVTMVRQSLATYLKKEQHKNLQIVPDTDLVEFDYPTIKKQILAALPK